MAWTNVKGFNFRSTSGFVTDGTNATFDLGAAYPRSVTIDGDTFNVGWDSDITANTRDRSNTADPRMAGIVFRGNATAGVNKWRIDLPSTGSYTIRVAMGDHDSARTILYRILDGTTALLTVGGAGVTTVADGFADASGVARASEAAWISGNVALTATFATTTCFLEIGDATGSAGDISAVAHFDIVQNASGSTLTASTGTFALAGQADVLKLAIPAGFGSFALSGQAATFTQAASSTLLAATGAFNVNGGLSTAGYILPSITGVYVLSGQSVNLVGPPVAGLKGSLALLGVGT